MIARVKRWHAAPAALLFFIPTGARAAEDAGDAARELARKTASWAGKGETVSIAWRNLSSLGSPEWGQVRSAFEAAFREAGGHAGDLAPAADARLTLSENPSQYLLVEEARKGDDRQVWMAAWKRAPAASGGTQGISLQKKLLWEQDEPILDVAFPGSGMLVLSATRVVLYARSDGGWEPRGSAAPAPGKPWPRDPRGRLRVSGTAFQAYLPGLACSGSVEPALAMECRPGDEPWVLESGSRAMLLANFAGARNYFDGRVMVQTGLRKAVGPFYSAAEVEDQGRPHWLLAMVDGRTQVLDPALDEEASIPAWGSDIAGTDAHCGSGSQVLATKAGDGTEPDTLQTFAIANRSAVPISAPVEFPGPVTALWTSGGTSVLAVVRNLATGKYEAYLVAVVCGS